MTSGGRWDATPKSDPIQAGAGPDPPLQSGGGYAAFLCRAAPGSESTHS